jgi:hypothetical protein
MQVHRRLALIALLFLSPRGSGAQELFQFPGRAKSRWASPENHSGTKGEGALENQGARGHPFDRVPAGGSVVLADVKGAGIITRIWMTIDDRSPAMLRSLRVDMFWEGATKPAVSAPLGDFFGVGLGQTVAFENALFASPEGRSFVSYIPMPFRKSARIVVKNESPRDLSHLFYDVDYTLTEPPKDMLYFHAYWRREPATSLGRDFRILPLVRGRGRYIGANVGVAANPAYARTWWGEGEVKIFVDGDKDHPTLVGTGSEDYVGAGWGLHRFIQSYQGAPLADEKAQQWAFYRYHVPDPIYFEAGCEVTLQQIGGGKTAQVVALEKAGVALRPLTLALPGGKPVVKLLASKTPPDLSDPALADGWTTFYRSDDVSATAYVYLDAPMSDAAPLAPVEQRTVGLR